MAPLARGRRPHALRVSPMWDALLLGAMTAYTLAAPYTKVEESFNMQATHDLLAHPSALSAFDHLSFPGVVPRSFIPPAALAAATSVLRPAAAVLAAPPPAPPLDQLLARWALGVLGVVSLAVLRRAVAARYTREAASCFALVVLSQFHLLFYMSRTLPNTFALVLTNLALAKLLHPRGSYYRSVAMLAVATALLRSELSVLMFMTIVTQPLTSPVPLGPHFLPRTVRYGLGAAVITAAVSIVVDSIFWRRLCYPELEVFYYNAVLGKSANWGTQHALWYFTSALPRALGGALPLAAVGAVVHPRDVAPALLPATLFVAAYSFLPHKELRFIFYALPPANIAAAVGLDAMRRHALRLFRKRQRPGAALALTTAAAACLSSSAVLSAASLAASVANYPGGAALSALQARELRRPCESGWVGRVTEVNRLHIDVAAAMSGVTRFLERADGGRGRSQSACPTRTWSYSRVEGAELEELTLSRNFSHLLTEERDVPGFNLLFAQNAYAGFEILRWPPFLRLRVEPAIYVHVNKDARLHTATLM